MSTKRPTVVVDWYRTPISSELFKELHTRSDCRGWAQAGGYLAILITTGILAFWSWLNWAWYLTVPLVFLHGIASGFHANAVHELGHGTVFQTKILNRFFLYIYGFLGWNSFDFFNASHQRHHRYTLHPPDDLEVVLPIRIMLRNFLAQGFVNVLGLFGVLKYNWRLARRKFEGEWELACMPEDQEKLRQQTVRWSRILLIGHGLITVVSIATGFWIIPLLISFAPFMGGWLFFLCNNTQHIGLQDKVPDFRLCCRTILINPVFRFLYWQMNFHTEHHMYAAVPCYHLKRLHEAIEHDLPPSPRGLIATWREIGEIMRKQEADPKYQYSAPLPQQTD